MLIVKAIIEDMDRARVAASYNWLQSQLEHPDLYRHAKDSEQNRQSWFHFYGTDSMLIVETVMKGLPQNKLRFALQKLDENTGRDRDEYQWRSSLWQYAYPYMDRHAYR